jgi:predicted N-acetyltransferase YhbS
LVAETEGKLIGHILLTEAIIKSNTSTYPTLTLAPVSVHPGWQRMGVGSRLIHDVLEIACSIGFTSVIVVGHPDYYPRFGFSLASTFGIFSPFEVPDEAFMALELVPDALKNVSGTVIYPNEFFNP